MNTNENTDKNTNYRLGMLIVLCIIVVGVLAYVNNSKRVEVPEHNIAVAIGNDLKYIDLDKLSTTDVKGQIVNGKGEVKDISGKGILLKDIISDYVKADYNSVKIVADDEYSAEIKAEELGKDSSAYLLIEDSEARLYVFGDPNSKRNVSNVVRIEVGITD